MKLYIKFLITVLVIGLAAPFFLTGPDGRPLMSVQKLGPDLAALPSTVSRWWNGFTGVLDGGLDSVEGVMGQDGGSAVYRWQDSNGQWQYSDLPPPSAADVEKVVVAQGQNVMDAIEVPEKPAQTGASGPSVGVPLPLSISPGQVEQLVDDAKQVNKLMEERNEVLKEL
ncbi:hypothetical protein NBRC116494_31300 [Aurantivibrio plasticivorans]